MNDFDPLTIALENWYEKPLSDIPDNIRQRIERDIAFRDWDNLTLELRREIALQRDHINDPANAPEYQYWDDFYQNKDEIEILLQKWERVETPTASDLEIKQTKLSELREELIRMNEIERRAQQNRSPIEKNGKPNGTYIAYPKALKILADRFGATPEELAAWIFLGPEQGGISAYTNANANELNPPRKFYFGYSCGYEDYLAPLMACWFKEEDIARFQPVERYITGKALIERWGKQLGIQATDYIRAKIKESRLLDMHPTMGPTEWSKGGNSASGETALFAMSEILAIEEEDGIVPFFDKGTGIHEADQENKLDAINSNGQDEQGIPGKMPRIAIGRLAVEAAWQIELEKKARATDREVFQLLVKWARSGQKADVLLNVKEGKICWVTGKAKEKTYDIEVCGKTIGAWNKSRK